MTHDRGSGDGRTEVEVRWFLRGPIPQSLRPAGPAQLRTDVYCLDSLTATSSRKFRGTNRILVHKTRIGMLPVVVNGVPVWAEHWSRRLDADVSDTPISNRLEIRKKRWRTRNVEVTALRISAERWWTVAVTIDDGAQITAFEALEPWTATLVDAQMMSYPAWLLDRQDRSAKSGLDAMGPGMDRS